MDRLTALGTGNAAVTRCYNTCFLLDLPQGYLLCDAGGGNGILSQLEKAGVDLAQIHHLILTHAHSDHLLGAVWVVRMVAAAMNAVIGVGAPWYTSGTQEPNGTAPTLNTSPTSSSPVPSSAIVLTSPPATAAAIPGIDSVPANPYSSATP